MSVTEQMVIHAQEFNVRIDQLEKLSVSNHQELMGIIFDLSDKIDMLEFRIKELSVQ